MKQCILIQHLTGSKAHRVDQFPLDDVNELTVGRGPESNVSFDSQMEDTVSRNHAVIRVMRHGRLSFKIADLGSSNGVRVNGRPVHAEQYIDADDVVELGPDGPSFRLAVEPASLRIADSGEDPTVRRSMATLVPKAGTDIPAGSGQSVGSRPRFVRRVGLTTLLSLLAVGAGAMFGPDLFIRGRDWIADEGRVSLPSGHAGNSRIVPQLVPPATPVASQPPAPSAVEPRPSAATAPAAMVYIEARWRLYDKSTGQPVYQKIVLRQGQRLPCFVETADGRIVPWLTTEDEDHTNSPIGSVISGSGFIVSGEGSIITTRHIAAGWMSRYFQPRMQEAALFRERAYPGEDTFRLFDPGAWQDGSPLANWIPGMGGRLFRARSPIAVSTIGANLEGRNDSLNVLLPSSHASTPARLVLISGKADIAELHIDVGSTLPTIPLARAADARPGQTVTAFFYPAPLANALDQAALMNDASGAPHLASARGTIVATHGPDDAPPGRRPDLYQVSIDPGTVADGGPVIGADGAALGVVTSDPADGAGRAFAYPVGAARDLLDSQ
jgi:serine protease Do